MAGAGVVSEGSIGSYSGRSTSAPIGASATFYEEVFIPDTRPDRVQAIVLGEPRGSAGYVTPVLGQPFG